MFPEMLCVVSIRSPRVSFTVDLAEVIALDEKRKYVSHTKDSSMLAEFVIAVPSEPRVGVDGHTTSRRGINWRCVLASRPRRLGRHMSGEENREDGSQAHHPSSPDNTALSCEDRAIQAIAGFVSFNALFAGAFDNAPSLQRVRPLR
jgi:hypothetical protein